MTGAVLWDLDGTLLDSEEYHWLSWRDTMASLGRTITRPEFLSTFGLRNDEILPRWLGPGATRDEIGRVSLEKESVYRKLLREHGVTPLPGAAEWLSRLHQRGWRQAIASSAPRKNVEVVLEILGIANFFDAVVSAEDVSAGKPDPKVFLVAATRLGATPRECIVVEDAPMGVEAAHRAGMRCIGVSRNGRLAAADLAVASLDELPEDAFACLLEF
ncbi:MAG TPA: HAD family phosphatase [Bryobacteraceae bacterium]|nr:HAD family phosphatase [Bryobacteraceae bacterium]